MTPEYIPGVCNIGPTEIAMRSRVGWLGLGVTILVFADLVFFRVNPAWRWLIVIPAALSATGFLQAYFHFCAGYGLRGLMNFGTEIGKGETVMQAEFRKQDKARAQQLFLSSLLIGIIVALIAVYV